MRPNGHFDRLIEYSALAIFFGALVVYAYLLIDPLKTEQSIPPSLTLVVGFGVAFIRDYLTEKRIAGRLDRAEVRHDALVESMVEASRIAAQKLPDSNTEQDVATRTERRED
jgi:hypothetical protein